jgi:hypothetical protein
MATPVDTLAALRKLAAGPLRRGRGNVSEEARQLQDEQDAKGNLLRQGILELRNRRRTIAYSAGFDGAGSGLELFVSWGSGPTLSTAGAMHTLGKPFDACKIVKIKLVSATALTTGVQIRIYRFGSGTASWESGLQTGVDQVEVEPDYTWPDGPLVVSVAVAPTTGQVGLVMIVEEVDE